MKSSTPERKRPGRHAAALPVAPVRPSPVLRREQLRNELLVTVDALNRRRADLVPEGFIADYVALDWLEWNGGTLRTTLTGANICKQMQAGLVRTV